MDALTRLLLAARDGDRDALSAWLRRSQAEVWRLCAHLGGRQAADDLTQEVFLRALGSLPRFRADASARTWLLVIARRTVADHVRGQARRRRLGDRLIGRREVDVSDPAGQVAAVDSVARLDTDRREAFVLTQVLGLRYAEAAEVCGVPIGTIRSRVARARTDLLAAGWSEETAT